MSRVFAYCRVSKTSSNPENQVGDIKTAGFALEDHRIEEETISGSVPAKQRPGFQRLLAKLERGDVLICTKLDRLGRNAMDIDATISMLTDMQVRVYCLQLGGMDLTSPAGAMTMRVLGAVAQFEKELLIERTKSGLARAKSEKKKLGRRATLTKDQRDEVKARRAAGESLGSIAKLYEVSRAMIQRIEKSKDTINQ